jgi:hypothetical protein
MIAWAAIGGLVGVLLGLTGAGGAVIAVPLFIHLTGATLQQATVYSLFAVSAAAALNWLLQRKNVEYETGVILAFFAYFGAKAAVPLKQVSPNGVIAALFVAVCIFSLANIWRAGKSRSGPSPSPPRPTSWKRRLLAGSASGVILGGLTTMTGLGGGVVLVPWLVGPMKLSMDRAVGTSLFTITLTALGSALAQFGGSAPAVELFPVGALMIAVLLSGLGARAFARQAKPDVLNLLRKWLLTSVIAFSVAGVILVLMKP